MRVTVVKADVLWNDQFHKAGTEIDMTDENLALHLIALGDVRKSDGRTSKDPVRPTQPGVESTKNTGR